jgi:hypothetical protein
MYRAARRIHDLHPGLRSTALAGLAVLSTSLVQAPAAVANPSKTKTIEQVLERQLDTPSNMLPVLNGGLAQLLTGGRLKVIENPLVELKDKQGSNFTNPDAYRFFNAVFERGKGAVVHEIPVPAGAQIELAGDGDASGAPDLGPTLIGTLAPVPGDSMSSTSPYELSAFQGEAVGHGGPPLQIAQTVTFSLKN